MKSYLFRGALLAIAVLAFAQSSYACDQIRRKYGVQTTVDFCLYTKDDTVGAVKVENAAHASGDTYLMKDEGNEANTTNGFTDEGSCYSIVLTATEMQAARIMLNIEDQSTKTWADACVNIETFGDPSAQFQEVDANLTKMSGTSQSATDLKDFADTGYDPSTHKVQGVVLTDAVTAISTGGITQASYGSDVIGHGGTLQSISGTVATLASSEDIPNNQLRDNFSLLITSASTNNADWAVRCITGNTQSNDQVTLVSAFSTTPTGTIKYQIIPTPNCNPAKWPKVH